MTEFKEVFNGIGEMGGKYEIRLNKDAIPVIHAPKKVPISL